MVIRADRDALRNAIREWLERHSFIGSRDYRRALKRLRRSKDEAVRDLARQLFKTREKDEVRLFRRGTGKWSPCRDTWNYYQRLLLFLSDDIEWAKRFDLKIDYRRHWTQAGSVVTILVLAAAFNRALSAELILYSGTAAICVLGLFRHLAEVKGAWSDGRRLGPLARCYPFFDGGEIRAVLRRHPEFVKQRFDAYVRAQEVASHDVSTRVDEYPFLYGMGTVVQDAFGLVVFFGLYCFLGMEITIALPLLVTLLFLLLPLSVIYWVRRK